MPIPPAEHRGAARRGRGVGRGRELRGIPSKTRARPTATVVTVDVRSHTDPRFVDEVGRRDERDATAAGAVGNRAGERMLGRVFRRAPTRRSASRSSVRSVVTTSTSSIRPSVIVPVLSSTTVSTRCARFEHVAAADHDAELRAAAGPDHDGGRSRQSERARAGDDEHGDGRGERVGRGFARRATNPRASPPRSRAQRERRFRRCDRRGAAPAPSHLGRLRRGARSAPARCRLRRGALPPRAGPRCSTSLRRPRRPHARRRERVRR